MLTAMRKTKTAGTGAGAGGVAEGDPAASSDSPGSNSTSSRISSSSSNSTSTSRGDVPTFAGREAHRQRWDGKIPALLGGRTRSQSRQHQMSADTADALTTHVRWRCPLPPSSEHASAGHLRCPRSFDVASTGTACARLGVRVSCRLTSVGALLSPRVWERSLCWC